MCILAGIGLSAACGFRVFVPLLIMSIACNAGHLTLAQGFDWIGSDAALIAFSIATVLEIAAYYIPAVDNFLDTIASPTAVVAGIIVTASMVQDMSPFLRWTLAVIAGGGTAAAVQATTVVARGKSTVFTIGLGNPLLATVELFGAVVTAAISVLIPILLIGVAVVVAVAVVAWLIMRRRNRARTVVEVSATT
jgi:hypothetical protein